MMAESKYREAGVDIDAGNRAVERMKPAIRATFTPAVLADVGVSAVCMRCRTCRRSRCWSPRPTGWAQRSNWRRTWAGGAASGLTS